MNVFTYLSKEAHKKGKELMEIEIRQMLVHYGASLFQRSYSVGSSGNISVRLPDGSILATPTNSCLGSLDADQLAKVTLEGEQISGDKMSKEIPFHLALYRARPEVNAVVHLHSTYLTALSCRSDIDFNNAIRPFTPYFVMKVGNMPVIPYFKPGSHHLATALAERAHESNAFLLANHGPVVLGTSLTEAINTMEELEETARLFFILQHSPIRYLTEEEIMELNS